MSVVWLSRYGKMNRQGKFSLRRRDQRMLSPSTCRHAVRRATARLSRLQETRYWRASRTRRIESCTSRRARKRVRAWTSLMIHKPRWRLLGGRDLISSSKSIKIAATFTEPNREGHVLSRSAGNAGSYGLELVMVYGVRVRGRKKENTKVNPRFLDYGRLHQSPPERNKGVRVERKGTAHGPGPLASLSTPLYEISNFNGCPEGGSYCPAVGSSCLQQIRSLFARSPRRPRHPNPSSPPLSAGDPLPVA